MHFGKVSPRLVGSHVTGSFRELRNCPLPLRHTMREFCARVDTLRLVALLHLDAILPRIRQIPVDPIL